MSPRRQHEERPCWRLQVFSPLAPQANPEPPSDTSQHFVTCSDPSLTPGYHPLTVLLFSWHTDLHCLFLHVMWWPELSIFIFSFIYVIVQIWKHRYSSCNVSLCRRWCVDMSEYVGADKCLWIIQLIDFSAVYIRSTLLPFDLSVSFY